MTAKGEEKIVNTFLTQGKGHYYLNIVCFNSKYNRSYEIPKKIIQQIKGEKLN